MEGQFLSARINDTIDASLLTEKPKFLGFLSQEEAALAKKILKKSNASHCFFGGAEDCERVFLCCCPEWLQIPDFPITAVTFKFRKCDSLKHRDFLGSLMALGLKREAVGDILISQGRAVAFLSNDIADYVVKNIRKIGSVGVEVAPGFDLPLPERSQKTEATVTVSSMRLDCVVAALGNCSRNKANELIQSALVSLNSEICQKNTKELVDGDVLTIRRVGKFEIISTDKITKKGRIVLAFKGY